MEEVIDFILKNISIIISTIALIISITNLIYLIITNKKKIVFKVDNYSNVKVDEYVKDKNDNPIFGILLCKDKKKVTAELALKDVNKPIGVSEYKIISEIPEFLENALPSIEDIEKRLEDLE